MDILVGFRFHPTDQEIICLLGEKRRDPSITVDAIFETNICNFEPPELSRLSPIQSDRKWSNFFSAPKYINPHRKRVCRATKTGYWKLTGKGYPIKDKRSKREIGFKRVLVFYELPGGSKEIKTSWVMHQFSATDSPLYKKDFVVCRLKNKGNKKRRTSTNVGGQQQKKLRLSTNNQVKPSHENTTPGLPLSVIENTSPELQFPAVGNVYPELQLRVLEDTYPKLQLSAAENTYQELQLSVVDYPELHLPVVGNTFPQCQSLIAENTSLEWHELPDDCSDSVYNTGLDAVETTLQVDPPHLAACNALTGYKGLVQSSLLAVPSPVNPEQESSSSGVCTDDYNGLVSPFSIAWEEDIPLNVQDVYSSEEDGDSTLYFKSSKSMPGFCGGDRNETDTEFTEWLQDTGTSSLAYNITPLV